MKVVSSIWAKSLVAAFVVMSVSSLASAATDVTGTWNLTVQGGGRGGGGGGGGGAGGAGGGGGRAATPIPMKLKQDGDKLTGTIAFPAGRRRGGDQGADAPPAPAPVEIKNGKITADGAISFEVTQTRGQNEITSKYTGKVDGDKITGEVERPGRNGGDPTKSPWTATKGAATTSAK